jgi:hypothetical protein
MTSRPQYDGLDRAAGNQRPGRAILAHRFLGLRRVSPAAGGGAVGAKHRGAQGAYVCADWKSGLRQRPGEWRIGGGCSAQAKRKETNTNELYDNTTNRPLCFLAAGEGAVGAKHRGAQGAYVCADWKSGLRQRPGEWRIGGGCSAKSKQKETNANELYDNTTNRPLCFLGHINSDNSDIKHMRHHTLHLLTIVCLSLCVFSNSCITMKPLYYSVEVRNHGNEAINVEAIKLSDVEGETAKLGQIIPRGSFTVTPFFYPPSRHVTLGCESLQTKQRGSATVALTLPKEFNKERGSCIVFHLQPDEQRVVVSYEIVDPKTHAATIITNIP